LRTGFARPQVFHPGLTLDTINQELLPDSAGPLETEDDKRACLKDRRDFLLSAQSILIDPSDLPVLAGKSAKPQAPAPAKTKPQASALARGFRLLAAAPVSTRP
jgi:hypothetical protein